MIWFSFLYQDANWDFMSIPLWPQWTTFWQLPAREGSISHKSSQTCLLSMRTRYSTEMASTITRSQISNRKYYGRVYRVNKYIATVWYHHISVGQYPRGMLPARSTRKANSHTCLNIRGMLFYSLSRDFSDMYHFTQRPTSCSKNVLAVDWFDFYLTLLSSTWKHETVQQFKINKKDFKKIIIKVKTVTRLV